MNDATLAIRPATDADAQDLFGLLALCFADYPGCYVDPHDDLTDILRPASSAAARGMAFLVIEDDRGRVGACVAWDMPQPRTAELHRLYVRPDMRRRGIARRLVALCEDAARARGATRMILYSDTRFTDAHRLYESLGYRRGDTVRQLGDISNSREFHFEREL